MTQICFHQLPLWVRLAAALALLNSWVLIAEFVIDRYGLDKYLPFYRYGDICIWDFAALGLVTAAFIAQSRRPKTTSST
jgi:hypothetical protein